jgi:hypothetical protein
MGRIAKAFLILIVGVPIIAFVVFAYIVVTAFNSPDPISTSSSSVPAPTQCESGWTQATATMYFLNPKGCGPTRMELASAGAELMLGLINPGAKNCEQYNVSGTAYDSVKLVSVDVNGDVIKFTRSCVNGDEVFSPNKPADHAMFFGHLNFDKVITMRFPQGKVLVYQNTDYLKAADNLIRFSGITP